MIAGSMRFAEHEGERHYKELLAQIVADVQDPVAPVFSGVRHGQRSDHGGSAVTRLLQIVNRHTVSINHDTFRVRTVEIDLGHVSPPTRYGLAGTLTESTIGSRAATFRHADGIGGRNDFDQRTPRPVRSGKAACLCRRAAPLSARPCAVSD